MLVLQAWLPESPKWMLLQSNNNLKGDTVSTLHSLGGASNDGSLSSNGAVNTVYENQMFPKVAAQLRAIRPAEHDVDKEIAKILADAKAESLQQAEGSEVTWAEVFAYKKGTMVGVGLMFFNVRKFREFVRPLPYIYVA